MKEISCPSCGNTNVEKIDAYKYKCPYCGNEFTTDQVVIQQPPQQPIFNNPQEFTSDEVDKASCLMEGLCFFIPIIGIIMYFVNRETKPYSAKSYLIAAIAGFCLGLFFSVFS